MPYEISTAALTAQQAPTAAPRDTLQIKLNQIASAIFECEELSAMILAKLAGPCPQANEKRPEPTGINGYAMDILSRAQLLRNALQSINGDLA